MLVYDKVEALDAFALCDHCLGRQFARLGYGLENYERGWIIRRARNEGDKVGRDAFDPENVPKNMDKICDEDCEVCGGLFEALDRFVKRAVNAVDRYELETYLVGTRPPEAVIHAEERLWEEVGLEGVEPLKSELNRLIGKGFERRLERDRDVDLDVDFDRADINIVVDIRKDRVELQVNSLLIRGFYSKHVRGLPQTRWPCGNCRGNGCDECDWTGLQYRESVEQIVAEPFIEAYDALESKFHGAGREDVDARCLAKREFVLELIEPERRFVDIDKVVEDVNKSDKVSVYAMERCAKDMVERVKSRRARKRYRATVSTEREVSDEMLMDLTELVGVVEQATPSRVDHRRASKTRERSVYDVAVNKVDGRTFELEVEGEAGLYVKELISGDAEKTEPSVSQVLGMDAVCEELDVIGIEKPDESPL